MGNIVKGVKDSLEIRILQDIVGYEMKRAYEHWQKNPQTGLIPDSHFLIDPENYRIAAYVDHVRKDPVYLEMLVYEDKFVASQLALTPAAAIFDSRPSHWSKIADLAQYVFRGSYRIPDKVIERCMEREIAYKTLSSSGKAALREIYENKAKEGIPDQLAPNLVRQLYFRGILEVLLWDRDLNAQRELSIPGGLREEKRFITREGFFKDLPFAYSIAAFDNYRDRYRYCHFKDRTSSGSFLPRGFTPLVSNFTDTVYQVYTFQQLWKNYYNTTIDAHLYQNRDTIRAEKLDFDRWNHEFWAIKCQKKREGRYAPIINYITWQYVLPQEHDHRQDFPDNSFYLEDPIMQNNPRNSSPLVGILDRVQQAQQDPIEIDEKTRDILRNIAYTTGYSGLTSGDRQFIETRVKESPGIASAFHYARILENRRFFTQAAVQETVPQPPAYTDRLSHRLEQLKKTFHTSQSWLGLQGSLPLCSRALSSSSSSTSAEEHAAVQSNRYLQKGEVAIRQNPRSGRWELSGMIYLKKSGTLLVLLLPDGSILPLEIQENRTIEFNGWKLASRIVLGSIRFILVEK